MGLYERHIGPRIVEFFCADAKVTEERRKIVPQADGVVVEIGIGTGLNLAHYDPARVERIYGIDPGAGFLALGRRRFDDSAVPVTVLEAPAEDIPLPDHTADTAMLTYTLCSVRDPGAALAELRRVLKPDGRLLFLEHGRSHEQHVARWQDRLNWVWRPIACGCNLNRDTTALLTQARFAIQSLERFYLPGEPKPVGCHSRGVARPALAT